MNMNLYSKIKQKYTFYKVSPKSEDSSYIDFLINTTFIPGYLPLHDVFAELYRRQYCWLIIEGDSGLMVCSGYFGYVNNLFEDIITPGDERLLRLSSFKIHAKKGTFTCNETVTITLTAPGVYYDTQLLNMLPLATIAVSPESVVENSGTNLVFTITLDTAPTVDTTINLAYSGTATAGIDYTGKVDIVTIPANSTSGLVTITPIVDADISESESITISIKNGVSYDIGAMLYATAYITEVYIYTATIAVSPESVVENSGTNLVFTITLDTAPTVDTTINLAYSGTATAGIDYTGNVNTITITAGSTTGTINITPQITLDAAQDKTVIVSIETGTGYEVGGSASATGTINGYVMPVATITVSPSEVVEYNAEHLVFTITLDTAPTVDTTINLAYSGVATADTDYTGNVNTVTISAGSTTGTITITPIDRSEYSDRDVVVTITVGTGYTIGVASVATAIIAGLPTIRIWLHNTPNPMSLGINTSEVSIFNTTLNAPVRIQTTINLQWSGTMLDMIYYQHISTSETVVLNVGDFGYSRFLEIVGNGLEPGTYTYIGTILPGTGYKIGEDNEDTLTIIRLPNPG